MSHECIDWKAAPPRPKTPFITISYGGTKTLARRGAGAQVHEFKALQHFAHRNLPIQRCVPTSLRFRTSCNLGCAPIEHGSVFEITQETWEEEGLRDLVGCLEVLLREHEEVMPDSEDESSYGVEPSGFHQDWVVASSSVSEDEHAAGQVQAPDEREEKGTEHVETSTDVLELKRKSEILEQTPPVRRHVVVSNKEDREVPDRKPAAGSRKQEAPLVDNSHSVTAIVNAPEKSPRDSALDQLDLEYTSGAERSVKKKEERLAHRSSAAGSIDDSRSPRGRSQLTQISYTTALSMPIKQESTSAPQIMSQLTAGQQSQEAELTPELSPKLVISIQHKPSAQRAQFSTKPHTRVGKVLAGACKSFRLDVNAAQLYLVVATRNDKGLMEEDFFMCDRGETVENAMAGMDERAEFVILLSEDL